MERAEQAVFDFKEKGKDALASAVKGMHLTQGLQKLQSSLHTVMLSMDQKIDRLGSMAEELHVAKGHLKNAFLKMKTGIFKRYLAGASAGNSTPSAWEKRKTEGSDPIKGSFLKGGESHERRNNHYLSCFGVRGVP